MIKLAQESRVGKKKRSRMLAGYEWILTAGQSGDPGACSMMDGIPNWLRSSCVTPLIRIVLSTPTGLSIFNLALHRMAVIRNTFFLPCSYQFPDMISLKK
ncbi:MAG TPA: hypothetical protein DCZ94_05470 [Lentisphaeria bacterium]|nr:MAG: hypothetical protein A2X48_00840 [Lentisphaerae bacterium GWF2_49_21]HBC86386.1 hypothetical protein [Lentisphaeria bacterium]